MLKLLIAVTALSFATIGVADAASHHKRHKRAHHHHHAATYVPAAPYAVGGPRPIWAQPGQCFTDEGYGRYWPCGAGPSTR
jgi:hypothetical protein